MKQKLQEDRRGVFWVRKHLNRVVGPPMAPQPRSVHGCLQRGAVHLGPMNWTALPVPGCTKHAESGGRQMLSA